MRFLFGLAIVFCLIAVNPGWAQIADESHSADVINAKKSIRENPPASVERTTTMSPARSADESIRRKLNEPLNVTYDETPWKEIESQFEKAYGFNIVLTFSAKDDSLTDDEPISENLTGISLRNGLRLMLRPKNATFIVKDGVMQIISLDDAEDAQYFSTNFINVRPILANIAKLEKSRIGKPRIVHSANNDKSDKKPTELVTAESLLTDLVHSTFQPDVWEHTGQGLATFEILGGFAIVSCPEEKADGLRSFLTDLDYHLAQE